MRPVFVSCLIFLALAAEVAGKPILELDTSAPVGGLGDGTIGWEFTTNTSISVSHLGYLDPGGGGFADAHEVAIWDSSQNLLASTTVQAGTSSPIENGFRYEPITPLQLPAGQTYVIGGRTRSLSGYTPLGDAAQGLVVEPEIDLVGGRTNGGNALLSFPTFGLFGSGTGYFGPSFRIGEGAPTVTPEPSTALLWAIVAFSASVLAFYRRRFA